MKSLFMISVAAITLWGCSDQLVQGPPAEGPSAEGSGRIAYSTVEDVGGRYLMKVMVSSPDGTGATFVADGLVAGSAARGRIAYTRNDSVFVATLSGGAWSERLITTVASDTTMSIHTLSVALSPDGTLLTYSVKCNSYSGGLIIDTQTLTYLTRADGSAGAGSRLPKDNAHETVPVFSPDSRWIALYSGNRTWDGSATTGEIWVLSTGSSGSMVRVASGIRTKPDGGSWLDWSPASDRIVYQTSDDLDGIRTVHIVNRDGSGTRKLADGFYPVWSPDGKRIAYIDMITWDIFVVDADGSATPRNITNGIGTSELYPQWSPDSKSILYTLYRGDNEKMPGTIRVVEVDNPSNIRSATIDGVNAFKGFWVE